MFHILYDGTVFDHRDHTVLGGDADAISARIGESFERRPRRRGGRPRRQPPRSSGPDRTLPANDLEVALLARGNGRRCFRRLSDPEVESLLTA